MIECKTYRWYGHSRSDPRAYRTKAEEKAWHERDPITVLRNKLISEGLCTEQELDEIKDKAFATIEDATQFAMNSPWPNGADVDKDVYVEETLSGPGHRERAEDGRQGPRGHRGLREDRRHLRRQDQERGGRDREGPDQVPVRHGRREHRRGGFARPRPKKCGATERSSSWARTSASTAAPMRRPAACCEEFGTERVIDTAISEAAIAGAAVGAALRGMRPIAEIMYVDFLTIAMDQLVHVGAYNRYMFGGKAKVPMVLRTEGGVGRCIAAHHSESLEAWLMHIAGPLRRDALDAV